MQLDQTRSLNHKPTFPNIRPSQYFAQYVGNWDRLLGLGSRSWGSWVVVEIPLSPWGVFNWPVHGSTHSSRCYMSSLADLKPLSIDIHESDDLILFCFCLHCWCDFIHCWPSWCSWWRIVFVDSLFFNPTPSNQHCCIITHWQKPINHNSDDTHCRVAGLAREIMDNACCWATPRVITAVFNLGTIMCTANHLVRTYKYTNTNA